MMQETTSHAVYTDPASVARNWHGTNIQDLRLVLLAVSANMPLPAPQTCQYRQISRTLTLHYFLASNMLKYQPHWVKWRLIEAINVTPEWNFHNVSNPRPLQQDDVV